MSVIIQSEKASRTTVGSLAKAFTTNVSAGNTIAVAASCFGVVASFASGNITDSQGNTYTLRTESHGDSANVGIWTAVAGSSAALTVTSNLGVGGANDLIIVEIGGPTVATVVLDTETAFSNSNTSVIPSFAIAATTGAVILTAQYNETVASSWSFSPANYTIEQITANGAGQSLVFADRIVNAPGTYGGESVIATGISSGIAGVTLSLGQDASVSITGSGSSSFSFSATGSGFVNSGPPPPPTDLTVICDSPPNGSVGVPYSHVFPASSGNPPYTWSYTGTLPPGLSLNTLTGLVSGTPTTPGTYTFTITVVDSA